MLPSAKHDVSDSPHMVLVHLFNHGRKSIRQLSQELELPVRTVKYAVRRLLEKDYLVSIPNLFDMRSVFYQIKREDEM